MDSQDREQGMSGGDDIVEVPGFSAMGEIPRKPVGGGIDDLFPGARTSVSSFGG